jgi:hypothetical protein
MIPTVWRGLQVIAHPAGRLDSYVLENQPSFRGEEAFDAEVLGLRRWAITLPEPLLEDAFPQSVPILIGRKKAWIAGLVIRLADGIASFAEPVPMLVGVLRAAVLSEHLLPRRLSENFKRGVPLVALSLFQGLGWDAEALSVAIASFLGRPVLSANRWTSGGGVANELNASFEIDAPVPFSWQADIHACLVGRAADRENAWTFARRWKAVIEWAEAVGLRDGLNDRCRLAVSHSPATLARRTQMLQLWWFLSRAYGTRTWPSGELDLFWIGLRAAR